MNSDKQERKLEELLRLWSQKSCEYLWDDLYEHSQGRLKGEEKKRVENHLSLCSKCQNAYKEFLADICDGSSKEIALSIAERIKTKMSLLPKRLWLTQQLKSLKSALSFPFNVTPLGATRGDEKPTKTYRIGELIVLKVETPREGHVMILRYDNKGYLQLVFPRKKGDNTFIGSGEEKTIGVQVSKPAGKQTFKAIFVSKEVLKPNSTTKEIDDAETIEMILNGVSQLQADEWIEVEYDFEVNEG